MIDRDSVIVGWYVDIKQTNLPITKIRSVDNTSMGVDEKGELLFIYPSFLFLSEDEAQRIQFLLVNYRTELLERIARGLNRF